MRSPNQLQLHLEISRNYQGLIVLNTKNIEGTVDETVNTIAKEFRSEGCEVAKITQLGRRQFAYASRHLEAGHYVNYDFSGPADAIKKIQARLKLNGNVHLQHFQRVA